MMDLLAGVFPSLPAPATFLLRCLLRRPFALEIADGAPLTLIAAAHGDLVVIDADGSSHRLPRRSVALVRGPRPWTLADDSESAVVAVIRPGQVCETVDGTSLELTWARGIRTWGNADEGSVTHVVLSGTYELVPATAHLLLDHVPEVLVVTSETATTGLLSMLDLFSDEIVADRVTQPVVLDRMLDLTVAFALRDWMTTAGLPPSPVRGQADPIVGSAIHAMQSEPATPWTIQRLARTVGVSRATLAKRFQDSAGTSPIAFLTRWRLAIAAERLSTTDESIGRIAADVGYGSAFALSTAFKRHYGVSPTRYRAASCAPST
jgi:AraC-like DNA-binding protein